MIRRLIEFWYSHNEPKDLAKLIDKFPSTWGQHRARTFFRQVYEDLCGDGRSKYATYTSVEFRRHLETEYDRITQTRDERQAQAATEAKHEAQARQCEHIQRKARAEFDALSKEMEKATKYNQAMFWA